MHAGGEPAESLSDALVSAYRNSGLLDQQRALLRASDEDVAVAVAATRPVINYALDAGWTLDQYQHRGVVTTARQRLADRQFDAL